jgi:ribosomal protein L32
MGKLIFWVVVVFVALFALRLVNVGKAKRRTRAAEDAKKAGKPDESMVRCSNCGVFLPQGDARPVSGGYVCGDPACSARP